jgi:6-phosphogluconate dehydrogenase
VQAPTEEGVLKPVLNAALTQRFASRGAEDVAEKVLSTLRYQFGGHEEKRS